MFKEKYGVVLLAISILSLQACTTKEQDFGHLINNSLSASSSAGPVVCGFGGGSGGSNDPNKGIISDHLIGNKIVLVFRQTELEKSCSLLIL
jgi:hypothetical protein